MKSFILFSYFAIGFRQWLSANRNIIKWQPKPEAHVCMTRQPKPIEAPKACIVIIFRGVVFDRLRLTPIVNRKIMWHDRSLHGTAFSHSELVSEFRSVQVTKLFS